MKSQKVAEHFSRNLRIACRYYPSISAVCRRIGINRQQLNTYLSGGVMPSLSNFKKIADFFGVDESEMLLDSKEFAQIMDGRSRKHPYHEFVSTMMQSIISDPENMLRQLAKYRGYYYCLLYSCGHPKSIIRSLVHIREKGDICTVKTIEILDYRDKAAGNRAGFIFKRNGILFKNSGRLFIFDYERAINYTPSMTILFPSNRNQAPVLKGVHLNVSGGSSQLPFASRVVYQNLGSHPDLRAALRKCGLLRKDCEDVSDELKALLDNDTHPRGVLQAHE